VESIIVIAGSGAQAAWYDKSGDDASQENRMAMERFVTTGGCRRLVLGAFMDGRGQRCGEAGGELCDSCITAAADSRGGKARAGTEEGEEDKDREDVNRARPDIGMVNAYGRDQKRRHKQLDLVRQWLTRVEGKCGTCYIRWLRGRRDEGKRAIYEHSLQHGRTVEKEAFVKWRGQIRFGELACCWKCGLPQAWCDSASTGRDCVWRDQVLPLAMSVATSNQLRELVKGEFGIDAGEARGYREWLGRSVRVHG
jgi:hypothetical protein